MTQNKKYILILSVSILLLSTNVLAQADDNGYKLVDSSQVPEILSKLSTASKSNYEKIKTWECQITEDSMITIKGETAKRLIKESTDFISVDPIQEIQRFSNAKTSFKIDMAKNLLFSISTSTEPYIYKEPEKEEKYPSKSLPEELINISTPDHQIQIVPYSKNKDNVTTSRMGIKRRAGKSGITDPRVVFNAGGKTLWLLLSQFSQSLQIPDIEYFGVVIKEKSDGKKIIYRLEISDPNESWHFMVLELNSETGFNYTCMENWFDENLLMSKIITEFVEINGTFLPNKWKVSHYSREGRLEKEESITVKNQQINNTVPESAFSEQTYLKDGDHLLDEATRQRYKYENGKLIKE